MNEYQETYEKEISLVELMFYCLKKWRWIVAHYRNMYGDNVSYNAECYLPDTDNESSSCICYPESWFDQNLLRQEIFGDNYD